MSDDAVISVENLGKCYRIHHALQRPRTMAEAVRKFAGAPFNYLASRMRTAEESELFWALKDVSFEIKRGEVVGIVGRNGAGKSTLLKILSRITDPSTGRAVIRGRVNALLEVGTGFHEELTGRENVYMSAALHGLRKADIDRKFDEIVDFSGVEKFIDTPVKRYSSGMRVRLGFAVAASLEPEILVVDEVLAVGDLAFQRKCLGKMESVAGSGRTVLFVSHQMPMIESLCSRAVLLRGGHLVADGKPTDIVALYLRDTFGDVRSVDLGQRHDRSGSEDYSYRHVRLLDEQGGEVSGFRAGGRTEIRATVKRKQGGLAARAFASVCVRDSGGVRLFTLNSSFRGAEVELGDTTEIVWKIPRMPLTEGEYKCDLFLAGSNQETVFDHVLDAFSFNVMPGDFFGTGRSQGLGIDRLYVDFDVSSRIV